MWMIIQVWEYDLQKEAEYQVKNEKCLTCLCVKIVSKRGKNMGSWQANWRQRIEFEVGNRVNHLVVWMPNRMWDVESSKNYYWRRRVTQNKLIQYSSISMLITCFCHSIISITHTYIYICISNYYNKHYSYSFFDCIVRNWKMMNEPKLLYR